ncbi:MAG TPA: Hsp20/alpha crystallin family protein [bacterium]|nr:Hsp20/alpha crystallin family protein [bacterium]HPN44467.1 Hsp20/alpha crystallin family protein [bacterium]
MFLVKRNNNWNDYYRMPRMIDKFMQDFWNSPVSANVGEDSVVWNPRIDVKETKDAYEVMADLPGLKKEDIEVSLHENVLTLKGERKQEEKKEGENEYYMERTYGSFYRSFEIPAKVKAEDINATYKDGVLRLTLPKAEEVKPREIQIK